MINITDENRSSLIASCLIEAVNVLSEGGIQFKGTELVSKIDKNKLANMTPEQREEYKEKYRNAIQATSNGIRQAEENKRLTKEKEEADRKKAEEDRKRAEVAEKYDRLLKKQEERRIAMNKRFGRPLNETSYTDEAKNKGSWKLFADGKYIGSYSSPTEREDLIKKYENK